jgi:hypothetical protein
MVLTSDSDIVTAIRFAAVSAVRRRADRQAAIAREGTTVDYRRVTILTGEAAIAERLAHTLASLANELEHMDLIP